MKLVERLDCEVDAVLNECANRIDDGESQYPGKSYEEGVKAGIRWLLKYSEDYPVDLGK